MKEVKDSNEATSNEEPTFPEKVKDSNPPDGVTSNHTSSGQKIRECGYSGCGICDGVCGNE